MAQDVKSRIDELLEKVAEAYLKDQQEKNIRSSGKSAASVKMESTEAYGWVRGIHYFRQQRVGRRPGKFPPVDAILQWIQAKGITPSGNIAPKSLAFLIARKIARQGTDIFMGRRPALNVDEKIKELVAEFRKEVAADRKEELEEMLKT